ncbi:MAG: CRISPR-associated helicase Cas3' [Oscillospiraceae bacterium]|jgi:CRISPR-associated endonuclease/helicase Cas3|nr:CRISPR-associated helicase Cas3' [Oscillospiraceae bacterium]
MEFIAHKRTSDQAEQSVYSHNTGTAKLAKKFAKSFNSGDFAYTVALAHDIGKYSEEFQRYIKFGGKRGSVDHATAGGQLLFNLNKNSLGAIAAYCIMGHHGGLPNCGSEFSDGTLLSRLSKTVDDYSNQQLQQQDFSLPLPNLLFSTRFSVSFFTRMIFSTLVDADWLDTEAFMNEKPNADNNESFTPILRGEYDTLPALLKKLNNHLSGFKNPTSNLNKLRCELLNNCIAAAQGAAGLFTLTAPTGSGKTLSSLAFAINHAVKQGKERIIYVVPYTTIIEQNADVFAKVLGAENVVQHHSNIEYDDEDYRRFATENWDAPIIVTTNVQFFESLYSCKPSACRKLHNIANSIIVFDEAQMLPINYLIPCVRAMQELVSIYNCTAVLATATQSALEPYFEPLKATEIVSSPLEMYKAFKRVTYKTMPKPIDVDGLAAILKSSKQVLCIVNLRKTAQNLCKALGNGAIHLSTTMHPAHRTAVLKTIRNKLDDGEPCIVVATCLVEAGVDVNFPVVYREKNGLDSIIQAAGRCNREGKNPAEDSVVTVFELQDVKNNTSDTMQRIGAYEEIARKYADIAEPDAIHSYFEQLFYERGNEQLDVKDIVKSLEQNPQTFNDRTVFCFPFKDIAEIFKIIESATLPVFVPKGDDAESIAQRLKDGECTRALMRKAGRYMVNLYKTDIEKLDEIGAVEFLGDIYILGDTTQYSDVMGILLEPQGGNAIII